MIGYNKMTGYNIARYNADGTELSAVDSFSVVDSGVGKESQKTLTELIVLSGSQAKQQNKSVTDSIRTNDWVRFKEQQASPWED